MDKSLPANARDMVLPGPREIPHAVQPLSPCTTPTEPALEPENQSY